MKESKDLKNKRIETIIEMANNSNFEEFTSNYEEMNRRELLEFSDFLEELIEKHSPN